MEQVYVAIKKHMHKSFEGPEMVKKKISSCVASAPRENDIFDINMTALSEGPRPISEQAYQKQANQFSQKTSRPSLKLNPGLVYYAPEFKSLTLRFRGFV